MGVTPGSAVTWTCSQLTPYHERARFFLKGGGEIYPVTVSYLFSWGEGRWIGCRISCFVMFKNIYQYFAGILFPPSLWICSFSEKQPGLTWVVTGLGTFKECLNTVGYAWMLESSLIIHFKNIIPTEILFCPQNLH